MAEVPPSRGMGGFLGRFGRHLELLSLLSEPSFVTEVRIAERSDDEQTLLWETTSDHDTTDTDSDSETESPHALVTHSDSNQEFLAHCVFILECAHPRRVQLVCQMDLENMTFLTRCVSGYLAMLSAMICYGECAWPSLTVGNSLQKL